MYWISLKEENITKANYKVVVIIQSIAIFSLYLISYSTLNYGMYFNGGKGANLRFEKMNCRKKFSLLLSLIFIAPVKFILLEFGVAITVILRFLMLVFV